MSGCIDFDFDSRCAGPAQNTTKLPPQCCRSFGQLVVLPKGHNNRHVRGFSLQEAYVRDTLQDQRRLNSTDSFSSPVSHSTEPVGQQKATSGMHAWKEKGDPHIGACPEFRNGQDITTAPSRHATNALLLCASHHWFRQMRVGGLAEPIFLLFERDLYSCAPAVLPSRNRQGNVNPPRGEGDGCVERQPTPRVFRHWFHGLDVMNVPLANRSSQAAPCSVPPSLNKTTHTPNPSSPCSSHLSHLWPAVRLCSAPAAARASPKKLRFRSAVSYLHSMHTSPGPAPSYF